MHEQSCCFTLNLFFFFAVLVAVAVVVVCYTTVFSVVTQRSSPQGTTLKTAV